MEELKNILITGNLGYVGSVVVPHLRTVLPEVRLSAFDRGYFAACLTESTVSPDASLDRQTYGDMRDLPGGLTNEVDTIVHLAAISNDPIGKEFAAATAEINFQQTITLAQLAKASGARRFVFASSCSVYGAGSDKPRDETCEVAPLTDYAQSKINSERELAELADENFQVVCMRFSTACGWSPRFRLDLVLNDFVANALVSKKIEILSDGSPWRPLIDVRDMARAIEWAVSWPIEGVFTCVNVGSEGWNFQILDLAKEVQARLPDVELSVNTDAPPDKRSYKVDFGLFRKIAPDHQPVTSLSDSINRIADGLRAFSFNDKNFRESRLIRLKHLKELQATGSINSDLRLIA